MEFHKICPWSSIASVSGFSAVSLVATLAQLSVREASGCEKVEIVFFQVKILTFISPK
jgi:hypothetical protein